MIHGIVSIIVLMGLMCCSLNSADPTEESDDTINVFCLEEPCRDTIQGFARIGPLQEDIPFGETHIAEIVEFDEILFARNSRGDLFRRGSDTWQRIPLDPLSYMGGMTVIQKELYVPIEDGEIVKLNNLGEIISKVELPDKELWCEAMCVLKGIQRVGNSIMITTTSFKERTLDRFFLLNEQGNWELIEGIPEYGFGSFRTHYLHNDTTLYGASFQSGLWKLKGTQWIQLKPTIFDIKTSYSWDGLTSRQDTSYYNNWGGVTSIDNQLYATTYSGFLYEINDDTLKRVDVPNKWFYSFGLDTLCGNIVIMNTGNFWNKEDNHWLVINGNDFRNISESSRYDSVRNIAYNTVLPDILHPGGTVYDVLSTEDTLFFAVGDSPLGDSLKGSVVSFPKENTPFCNPELLGVD